MRLESQFYLINGLEVTLNRVTDDPNLDVQDDQDRIDTRKKTTSIDRRIHPIKYNTSQY